jgi:hypothetical protein
VIICQVLPDDVATAKHRDIMAVVVVSLDKHKGVANIISYTPSYKQRIAIFINNCLLSLGAGGSLSSASEIEI